MLLKPNESQACAYLFQKTDNLQLMMEPMIRARNFTATWIDLQCLLPNRPISDKVI
jgi:hypothetical protein